tara:strand:- start:44 stop:964 length:921 start_codon:yes stop_codon:yes gene_type:complete
MPPKTRCRSSCLSAVEVCFHSCLPTDRRLTMGAGKVVLVDGDVAAPLAPNRQGGTAIYSRDGTVSSLSDGRKSGSGLGPVVLSQDSCMSGMERLRMQLAIGCLRTLSTLGHQGPAEGSVLGEEIEDDTLRMDHQMAASRQKGYRGGAHSPEKHRPAKEKVAPGSPSRSAMRPESPVHAYNAMPTAASDLDDAWLDDRMAIVPMARSAADSSAFAQQFCGAWQHTETLNLDEYLKHIGVSWAKRTVRPGSSVPTCTRVRVESCRKRMRVALSPQTHRARCRFVCCRRRSHSRSSPSRAGRSSTALCR